MTCPVEIIPVKTGAKLELRFKLTAPDEDGVQQLQDLNDWDLWITGRVLPRLTADELFSLTKGSGITIDPDQTTDHGTAPGAEEKDKGWATLLITAAELGTPGDIYFDGKARPTADPGGDPSGMFDFHQIVVGDTTTEAT
jgi:hypothetical protein